MVQVIISAPSLLRAPSRRNNFEFRGCALDHVEIMLYLHKPAVSKNGTDRLPEFSRHSTGIQRGDRCARSFLEKLLVKCEIHQDAVRALGSRQHCTTLLQLYGDDRDQSETSATPKLFLADSTDWPCALTVPSAITKIMGFATNYPYLAEKTSGLALLAESIRCDTAT